MGPEDAMAVLEDLREKTGELLDEGLQTGSLTPEEHSWRRGHLAHAQTVEALEALVEDLLSPEPASPTVSQGRAVSLPRASQMTLMASRTFSLHELGRRSELVTIMGSTKIDLRNLDPAEGLTLELVTVMGDATVEVPAGIRVRVECTPIMGDCHVAPNLQDPEALVRITGVVIMGSLRVVPASR